MVILIAGATHTGKPLLSQELLRRLSFPYTSIDHLKMGLIRSGFCRLTPESDDGELTAYLWPIVREMIKTVIENGQNLIVEGCYIPPDYQKDFSEDYLKQIRYVALIFSETYLHKHYIDIVRNAGLIENRQADTRPSMDLLIKDNHQVLNNCREYGLNYLMINDCYEFNWPELLNLIVIPD